jgi:hypothetical protein
MQVVSPGAQAVPSESTQERAGEVEQQPGPVVLHDSSWFLQVGSLQVPASQVAAGSQQVGTATQLAPVAVQVLTGSHWPVVEPCGTLQV